MERNEFIPALFDGVFQDFYRPRTYSSPRKHSMPIDLLESEDAYQALIDMPGVKKDQVEVTLEQGKLMISVKATEKEESTLKVLHREREQCVCFRTILLPEDAAEEVEALLKDGVLLVTVKKVPAKQPKKIAIN